MTWKMNEGAEHESDVTRKFTVYNDSCNSNNEDDAEWDLKLQNALWLYNEKKVQEFLDEEIDEDLMPMVLSAQTQRSMIEALSEAIGEDSATRIVEKQARKMEWNRAQWKRDRKRKRYRKVMRGISAAAAVIVIFLGVGIAGDQAGAWSLPKISFNTIDRDTNTKIVLESGSDIVRTEIEEVYELGMVLDGYELKSSIVDPEASLFIYENENKEIYSFTQQISSFELAINTEYEKEEIVETLYGDAILYIFNENHCLSWNYQGYSFLIEGKVSGEQLLELQGCLRIRE